MQFQYSRIAASLCTASLALSLLISGCSDSDRDNSSSVDPTPTPEPTASPEPDPEPSKGIKLAYDADGNGIPDVFEDYPSNKDADYIDIVRYDKDNNLLYSNGEFSQKTLTRGENELVLTAPVRISSFVDQPYTETSIASIENESGEQTEVEETTITRTPDCHYITLEGGKRYTITLQDEEGQGGYIADFQPDLRVIPEKDFADNEDAPGLKLNTLLTDDALRSISLSFTPETSGIYCIAVRNAGYEIADSEESAKDTSYCFMVFPNEDTNEDTADLNVTFTSSVPGYDFVYTSDEIQDLRNALAPYVKTNANTKLPQSVHGQKIFDEKAEEAFNSTLAIINSHHIADYLEDNSGSAAKDGEASPTPASSSGSKTKLAPTMNGFYWDDSTFFGDGISAMTGMPCRYQSGAIKKFDDQLTEGGSYNGASKIMLVDNTTSHEEAIGVDTTVSVSVPRAAFSNENKYTRNIKYGSNTTTLLVSYTYSENSPRRLADLHSYELTDDAAAYLESNGEEAFREAYGDYFVGGATYGARYFGTLVIKTSNVEKMTEIKNTITASYMQGKIDNTFSKKVKDATSNCEITLNEITIGETFDNSDDDSPTTGSAAIDTLVKHYQSFKNNCENSEREHKFDKLNAYLIGFNQISGGEAMSDSVNIPVKTFTDTRTICSQFLTTKATVASYLLQPDSHFVNGASHKRDIENKQNNLATELISAMNDIVSNEKTRQDWLARTKKERDTIIDKMGRYQLYRSLEDAAAAMKGKGMSYGSYGYQSYYNFSAPNSDIYQFDSGEHNEEWHIGWRKWDPTFNPGNGQRVCYIYLGGRSSKDKTTGADLSWDGNSDPPLSRTSVSFHVESGYDRGLFLSYAVSAIKNIDQYSDFSWSYK
ncbi:MAG: hypothetical protein Q4F00_05485 [bacterium]|nr:hypothetical protein [bacterium]